MTESNSNKMQESANGGDHSSSETEQDEELEEAIESIAEQMENRDYENIDVDQYCKRDTGVDNDGTVL